MTGTLEQHPFRIDYEHEPGRIVRGSVLLPGGARETRLPHVVILHGFKGFMDWGFFPEVARRFAEHGIAAVRFNVSGSGIGEDPLELSEDEAFARNTHSRELEDLERVRALVVAGDLPGLDPRRGALLGHSRGGGNALLHAAEDGGYRAVVTWAAVDDFDRFDEDTKRFWREQGRLLVHNARTGQDHRMDVGLLEDLERNRERLDILAACRRLEAPTLLVHGEDDTSVPVSAVERLARALPSERRRVLRIPGTGHTFGAVHPFRGTTPELELALRESLSHVERSLGDGSRP
jgi:uncharacterized protein